MAQYDRLSTYDVDITALKNVTVKDVAFTQGYAYVLTTTHIYRHPLTSGAGAGTVLNKAITSGIGNAQRITSDATHVYVAYADGTTKRVEKRSISDLAVANTWTLALKLTNDWTTYSSPKSLSVLGIATNNDIDHFYVIGWGPTSSSTAGLLIAAAFKKSDGTHIPTIAPWNNSGAVQGDTVTRGTVIFDSTYVYSYGLGSSLGFVSIVVNNDDEVTSSFTVRAKNSTLPIDFAGLGYYKGVAWVADPGTTKLVLQAWQFSSATPSTPFVNPPSGTPTPGVKTAAITYKTKSITGARYKNKTLTGIRYKDLSVVFS